MARPRLKIDLEQVEKLAAIHCTNKEIAAVVGCDPSLLSKGRFSEAIEKGRERGKMTLRRKMFEAAMGGNITMMIWLSKQILGMREVVENKIDPAKNVLMLAYNLDNDDSGKSDKQQ